MNKKLFCFDLDGTLLDINKRIPDNNIKALESLKKNGHIVAIATGRMYDSALKVSKLLPFPIDIVASNGSVIAIENKVCHVDKISLEDHAILYDIMQKYRLPLTFFSLHRGYHTRISSSFRNDRFFNLKNPGDKRIENIHLKDKDTYLKYAKYFINGIVISKKKHDELRELRIELEKTNLFTIESSGIDNIEIIPKTSNKGIGTANLGQILGIPQEDIVVFGDAENDITMIKMAGTSIAMGNASTLIKNEADFITKSHIDNGIPYAIETLFGIK